MHAFDWIFVFEWRQGSKVERGENVQKRRLSPRVRCKAVSRCSKTTPFPQGTLLNCLAMFKNDPFPPEYAAKLSRDKTCGSCSRDLSQNLQISWHFMVCYNR